MPKSRIVSVSSEHGIEIPPHIMKETGIEKGDKFLIYSEAGVVHLRKVDDSAEVDKRVIQEPREREEFLDFVESWFLTNLQGFENRMTFQGNLSGMHLAEILLFLAMTKKTGVLILKRDKVTKKVYYENGDIVFAASSLDEERLGDILLQEKRITEDQYRESSERIGHGKRQGKVFVEMGVITPEELWTDVCKQAESIIYSLFRWAEGYFEFLEGNLPTDERIKLDTTIPNLILNGMRSAEQEVQQTFHLPGEDLVLHRLAGDWEDLGETELTPEEKEVLSQVNAGMTVDEVCRKSALPGDESRQILLRLLSAGLVRSARGKREVADVLPVEDSPKLLARIEQCNMIFRLITEYVRTVVGDRVHVILGAFFRGIDHGQEILFENVYLEPDGSLDTRPLLANIAEYLPDERESILIRGLNELLYFQLFAVRNNLGKEEEKQVISALREMHFID